MQPQWNIAHSLITFLLGCLTGVFIEWIRSRFASVASKATEARSETKTAIEVAYAPATQLLDDMIDAYPEYADAKAALRKLFLNNSHHFDSTDSQHLQIVLLGEANEHDLIQIRRFIQTSLDAKISLLHKVWGKA